MKTIIIGYGKMGREIEKILLERGHEVIGRTGKVGVHELERVMQGIDADVAIEFTHPESATGNIQFCLERGIPVVSGTTGWLDDMENIKKIVSQHGGAFMHSSNFSIGVNLFYNLNRMISMIMNRYPEYKAEIEEIHHTEKVDSPSGTAIVLAEELIRNHQNYDEWQNEKSNKDKTLGVISKREDDVKGTHTLRYTSDIDTLEFTHKAHSRTGFALGAVLAAEWLKDKKGFYTMQDFLQFSMKS